MSEDTALRSAQWFASVLDAMDDLVLVKGPRSRLLWANRAFRDCYGMTNDELHSLIDSEQSDPDDTLQYVRDDRRVFVERTTIDVPSEPVTDHLGDTRFFHTRKSPIYDGDGVVVMQVGVSRPIEADQSTDNSQEIRKSLHESTQNVRALIRSMPAPVVMLDAAHRVIKWNDAFERMIDVHDGDCDASKMLLNSDYEAVLEPQLPLLEEFDSILAGAKPSSRILELENAEGARRSFDVECRTWTDSSDAVSGTIAVFHEVTEMLAGQRKLRKANDELAQFNYRVSHDIVAPISTARGFLELAIDEIGSDDTEELAELLGEVSSQIDRLDNLIMDLSTLAHADVDRKVFEAIDLRQLIEELKKDYANSAGCELTLDVDLAIAELQSDPRRIRQVLANLIDNAAKYHDPKERVPRAAVRSRREGNMTVIEVSDNGIGIDRDFAERAFEMFTRGDSSSSGTGLGLYIIRKHIERLGGTLTIANFAKPTVIQIKLPDAHAYAEAA